jgi:hypothetical protein
VARRVVWADLLDGLYRAECVVTTFYPDAPQRVCLRLRPEYGSLPRSITVRTIWLPPDTQSHRLSHQQIAHWRAESALRLAQHLATEEGCDG